MLRSKSANWALAALLSLPCAAEAQGQNLPVDAPTLQQLVDAVSLDQMSEAALQACGELGVSVYPRMLDAWVSWREQQQIAPLRMVVAALGRRHAKGRTPGQELAAVMRERVLSEADPEARCASLLQDWRGPGMDAASLFPQARGAAQALVRAKLVNPPEMPAIDPEPARGQVLLPSQIPALAEAHKGGWTALSLEAARQALPPVYVKGRVQRWSGDQDRFVLVQQREERRADAVIELSFDAEAWVGRELVLRGVLTTLSTGRARLSDAVLVPQGAALQPAALPQAPLRRQAVLRQRVLAAPGRGIADKDLAAVLIHGEGRYDGGSSWVEDVCYLLRDGTAYLRPDMPPDQLDVAASRRLEPQRWARWRRSGQGYELQAQDDDGRAVGEWRPLKHHAVRPWAEGSKLDGSFSRSSFYGSLMGASTSSTRRMRFGADGRFEQSQQSLSSSGGMAAGNGAVISASSRRDGQGSRSVAGGTVGGAGAFSGSQLDDGAGRRGRYQLQGYVITLSFDDGHQERLLSFPVYDKQQTVYVGSGSLTQD